MRIAIFLLLGCASVASAAEPPAKCSVSLEQAYRAAGGARWAKKGALRIEGSIEIPGLVGRFGGLTDLRTGRYSDHVELGPFVQRSGYDGTAQWSEEKQGDVHVQDDELTRTEGIADRYDRTLSYWIAGRMPGSARCAGEREVDGARYVVHTIEPRGGRTFELWIDPTTRMVARRTSRNGPVESVSTYSDYRDVDGVKFAYAIEQKNSNAPTVTKLRFERVGFAAQAPDAELARPVAKLDDYSLPAGKSAVTFEARIVNNHTYVPVRFNGKGPYWVILDTGGSNVITPRLARELGLKTEGEFSVGGAGDATEKAGLAHVDELDVGGAKLRDQAFVVLDFEKLSDIEGIDQAGLVGYEVYRRFVVKHDYEHGKLTLAEPRTYEPAPNAVVVPFTFRQTIPIVDGSIDGVAGQFVIDTGSRGQLWMNLPFAEQHGFRARYTQKVTGTTGWGVGGAVRGELARGGVLKLGTLSFDAPLVDMPLNKGGASSEEHIAGNVGGGLLKRHAVSFDYSRQQMLFEPRMAQEPNDLDRAGLWINRAKDGFEVVDLIEGGPGDRAGLRKGDRIVVADGRTAQKWTLGELRDALRARPAGSAFGVEVERDGARAKRSIELTDLLPPWPAAAP